MNGCSAADERTSDRRGLLLTGGALFLALLSYSSYNAALTLIQAEWSLTNAEASLMFSAYLVGYALSSLILIPLTDRISPVYLLRGGLLVMVASQLLFALTAGSPWSGAALRLLMGAGHVAAYISGVQWVDWDFCRPRLCRVDIFFCSDGLAAERIWRVAAGLCRHSAVWRDRGGAVPADPSAG